MMKSEQFSSNASIWHVGQNFHSYMQNVRLLNCVEQMRSPY